MRVEWTQFRNTRCGKTMDKRTILAVVLCIGVWILWSAIFETPPKNVVIPDGGSDGSQAAVGAGAVDGGRLPAGEAQTQMEPPPERPEEQLVSIRTEKYEAVWSTRGASLKSFKLFGYLERNETKKASDLGRQDLVSGIGELGQPFAIRFRGDGTSFKFPAFTDWEVVEKTPTRIQFRYADKKSIEFPIITKTYTIIPDTYILDLLVEINNRGGNSVNEQTILDVLAGYEVVEPAGCMGAPVVPRSPSCFVNEETLTLDTSPGSTKTGEPNVRWAGINEQYFLVAAIRMGEEKAVCQLEARRDQMLSASLMYPETAIAPGGSASHRFRLFCGPKRMELLDAVRGGPGDGEQDAKLVAAVDFGWLGFLCHPMLWLLKTFFALVGNYGIAIIFLTIVVKLVMLPLTQKSMKSAREMAKLKPLMEELKKKFGADKQRMNQETMNLYKAHKINPLGGCFPMLLQMPIWIALYRTLYSAVELYQAPFIPGWIDDLSFRDPVFIMPIALGIGMFFQQKLSPTTADSQQAKMMLYIMPAFMTFIMLYLPSGLVIYIFVSSLLSIGHQVLYNRRATESARAGSSGIAPKSA